MPRDLRSLPLSGLVLCALVSASAAGDHGQGWDYKTQPGAACQPVSARRRQTSCAARSGS